MSVVRPRARRFAAPGIASKPFFTSLILAAGLFGAGMTRPAEASYQYSFSQVFTLSEACLGNFDAFNSYWWFDGSFFLDTRLYFDHGSGNVTVDLMGYADARGRNYRLGSGARMEIFFYKTVYGYFDPSDGTLRAKIPFWIYLRNAGGGWLPAQMRLAIYQEGVRITGVTLGSFDDY